MSSTVETFLVRVPEVLDLIAGPVDRPVSEVRLLSDVEQLSKTRAGALVILDPQLSAMSASYRFDIIVRRAVAREVAGIVLSGPLDAGLSPTARALCVKSGVALLRVAPDRDPNLVVGTFTRNLVDELSLGMDRLRDVVSRLDLASGRVSDPAELLTLVGEVLGERVQLASHSPTADHLAVPTIGLNTDQTWLLARRSGNADSDFLMELLLWRLAAEFSRTDLDRRRKEITRRRSAGELLLQLIEADRPGTGAVGGMARRLGIPIDGSHIIVRVELDNALDLAAGEVAAYELREQMAAEAFELVSSEHGSWYVTHDISVLILLWSTDNPLDTDAPVDLGPTIHRITARLLAARPELRTYVGFGTAHSGAVGMAATNTEARLAATAARARNRVNTPIGFDAIGLRSGLIEWYSSPIVRQSVDKLFAPLADLPPAKQATLLETLGTYLDVQGSTSRTAELLHLHRNAVRYRVQRAFDLLGVDESDTDQRLYLQLACRVRRGL